jgi:hypothetical protein
MLTGTEYHQPRLLPLDRAFIAKIFELPLKRPEPSVGTEPTKTPGVFYHGSPIVNIGDAGFENDLRLDDGVVEKAGTFFSQLATYSACYASKRGGGRIYRAEMITRNPFFADAYLWNQATNHDRGAERSLISVISEAGHDCIVAGPQGRCELIVIDKSVIRSRESVTVDDFTRAAPSLFYAADRLQAPDYAAGCQPLFSYRARAIRAACRGVVRPMGWTRPISPIFCDRAAWPQLDLHVLSDLQVDCLVDPASGDALALPRGPFVPLSRTQMRAMVRASARMKRGRCNRAEQSHGHLCRRPWED